MPRFLTPEWIAALDAAAREAAVPAGIRLTIQQVVIDDGGGGDVRYHLVLDRGELNAQQALEAGRLKLRGDIGHLAREGRALVAMEDVFAAVRAVTCY